MDDHPTRRRVIESLIEVTLRDPFRNRTAILGEVAEVTGMSLDEVQSLLPLPGTAAWVQDTGPPRIIRGGGFALDDVVAAVDLTEIRHALASRDPLHRRSAVDRLILGARSTADSVALVVQALGDPVSEVRLAAIPGCWRFDSELVTSRLRELAAADPSNHVRVAAIARLGLNGDRDPETVKALMSMVDGDSPGDLRAAAVTALGRCGRGYARVPSVVRSRLSWDTEAAVRSAALGASCLLTTIPEAEDFVGHVVPALSRYPSLAVEHQAALQTLARRVPVVVDALAKRSLDEDRHARRACAHLAGAMISSTGLEQARLIVQLADDRDSEVRSAAVYGAKRALVRVRTSEPSANQAVAALLEGIAGAQD